MIQEFCDRFIEKKEELAERIRKDEPTSYNHLFRMVCETLQNEDDEWNYPDPYRIEAIDHGHYQGTILFIVACGGYQPSTYWASRVAYGSCSACDSFRAIREQGWGSDDVTDQQVEDYLRMALHLVQGMKEI
jgi:hypothetical protein